MKKNKESAHEDATVESTIAKDLALPLRVLISPLKTFKQLATNPTAKGLLSLVALIIAVSAAALYASATKIVLTIGTQYVDFIATSSFSNWFPSALTTTAISIAFYWLTAAAGLALISRFSFRGSKVISLRTSLVVFGYLLSVFIALWVVRAVIYATLSPIQFPSSIWPPTAQDEIDQANALIAQNWSSLLAVERYFRFVAFTWLALLGAIAVKALQEISWFKAALISATGFLLTLTLLGLP